MQTLRRHYANTLRKYITQNTQRLRRYYPMFLRNYYTTLRKHYAKFTQIVYAQHANITQISLCWHYANIFCLRNNITQTLRRITQNKLRNHYANYAIITQIHYAEITQIHYANHYADYAIITQIHYANNITQFPKISLRRLRKYLFHYASLRNGQLADGKKILACFCQ